MKKMGFLGPWGTHSEAAAIKLNSMLPEPYELEACANIYTAIRSVETGELDFCLVPVENSIEGSINITLDTLAGGDELYVVRELIWGVHNQLMVKSPEVRVKRILSHAQPLAQCRDFILKHYPLAELEAVVSTAAAAKAVAGSAIEDGLAAICTSRAGEIYDLHSLGTNIEDRDNNCTRFYQLGLKKGEKVSLAKGDKTLIICQIDGKDAGKLCEVLLELATRDINMTRIESRPSRTGLGEYIFFLDVDLPPRREYLEAALQGIRRKSIWLRCLGGFPVIYANR